MSSIVNAFETKGGLNLKAKYDGTISASDVFNYLTNDVLHLPIKASLRTLHGPGKGCFVITVLTIAAEDLAVSTTPTNFPEKVMAGFGRNTKYKKDILDLIAPFRLPTPEEFEISMRDEQFRKRLIHLGIWGKTLEDLINFSDFRYSPNTGFYIIYLDTEKIIKQMAENPLDNELKGVLSIDAVYGERDSDIRWDVSIDTRDVKRVRSNYDFTVDQILKTAR